jgi:hypothetical protein
MRDTRFTFPDLISVACWVLSIIHHGPDEINKKEV